MKSILRIFFRTLVPLLLLTLSACRNDPEPGNPLSDETLSGMPLDGEIMGFDEPTELGERGMIGDMQPVDSSAYAPVYFAFDSYTLAPSEMSKVREMADHLNSQTGHAVILEGHTDERGSREYNLALGERRALAVRESLITLGVEPDRIQTLSYGEEQPAVEGFDESAWSLNRRVEFQLMR